MKKLSLFFALSAGFAFAGENLILNGTFEGSGSQSTWGAYANHSSFSCMNWTFDPKDGAGLGTPNGTWLASGLAVGDFALFMQPNNKNVTVSQTIASIIPGDYRLTFKYTARPSHTPGVVEAWLGDMQIGNRISTTATSLQNFSQEFAFAGGDNVVFKFYSPDQKADWDIAVEDAQLRRLDATIGEAKYIDLAEAMKYAAADDVIVYETGGNNATFATATYIWNGNLPKVSVPGICTVKGTITVVANGGTAGTYTLMEVGSFNFEYGASFAIDTSVHDRFERTLAVDGNKLVLTVTPRDNSTLDEYVVNGNFDMPGTQYGVNGANTWGYTYTSRGFALPGWTLGNNAASGQGVGLSAANGTWLVAGQTNGGELSFYMQGREDQLSQEFGEIPAGIYRYTFNYAARPSHTSTVIAADVLRDGSSIYTFKTPVIGNTTFAELGAVVSLPEAGATGIRFTQQHPDTGDRAGVLDDISFRREAVPGWSLVDGTTMIAGAASIPGNSYVDGDAVIAANATPTLAVNVQNPALTVKGSLTVNGTVALTIEGSEALAESDYVLIRADSVSMAEGAEFVLAAGTAFQRNDTGTTAYFGDLVVTGKSVVLRIRNYDTVGTNNYLRPESERADTLYSTVSSWNRGHAPDTTDGNVILNYPGTIKFDSLVYIVKPWYFRNGLGAPIILDSGHDAWGYRIDGTSGYLNIAGGNGNSGWVEYRRGTHEAHNIYVANGISAFGRLDFTGATAVFRDCIQCANATDALSWVNITDGEVTATAGYNGNIAARTYNQFRMSGGKLTVGTMQLLAGPHSVFDGEVSGGDIYFVNNLKFGYGSVGATGRFVLSGGTLHLNVLITQAAANCEVTLLANGGVLAPYSATTTWMSGGTVTLPVGGNVILDTDGFEATLGATMVDEAGGQSFGIVKRGLGTLTLLGEQTYTGVVEIEGGTLAAPVAFAASKLKIDAGGVYSVANGAMAAQALPALELAGGARLAIDVDADTSDVLTATAVDLAGASAENPVTLDVNLIGLAELEPGKEYPVLVGNLVASDADKFAVAGVDGKVKIVNGTLYLLSSARVKVDVAWSGAANDGGSWLNGGNWTGGEAPQNGDTAVFNLGNGGNTVFDITGLALTGIRFGTSAGEFVHNGTDALKINGGITNLSSRTQIFAMPLSLGVAGHTVEIDTTGDTILTGAVTTVASTLVKKGAGTLGTRDTAVLSADSVVIEEGTLRIDERTGDQSSARLSAVVLSEADQIVWRNIKLSDVMGVLGRCTGSSMAPKIDASWDTFHWTNDGTGASVQYQVWDGTYTKCVCAVFTQVGSDVAARVTRACYSNSGSNVLGEDMSTGHNNQTIANAVGAGGYGVYGVRPILANGAELNTITIKTGAALDVNVPGNSINLVTSEPTHGKKIKVEGSGPDGRGALYNSAPSAHGEAYFGEVELTGDAKAGGGHLSVRQLPGSSGSSQASISGPYTLEIANIGLGADAGTEDHFTIYNAALDLARIDVTGKLQLEGANTGVVSNGINFAGGSIFRPYSATVNADMPLHFNAGAGVTVLADGGDSHVYSPSSIGAGATVDVSGSKSFVFHNAFTNEGTLVTAAATTQFWGTELVGGNYVANGTLGFGGQINSPESAVAVSGGGNFYIGAGINQPLAGYPKLGSIHYTGTGNLYFLPGVSDTIDGHYLDETVANGNVVYMQSDTDITTTLKNVDWNETHNFYLGHNNKYGNLVLDEGANLTIPAIFYLQDGSAPQSVSFTVKTGGTLTFTDSGVNGFQLARVWQNYTKNANGTTVNVDGGTIAAPGMAALVGTGGGNAWFNINDGLVSMRQFEVHHTTTYASIWRDANDACVSLKGGTLELGAGGFLSAWPSFGKAYTDLAGGTLKAAGDVKNKYAWVATAFGASPIAGENDGLLFDLNGHEVTWNEPLAGGADVTITGGGSFASTVNLQSLPIGHWTITNTTSEVNLAGAAGFAGGLTLAPDTAARVDISSEGLVEWGFFSTAQFANIDALIGYNGPLPYTANAMRELHFTWDAEGTKAPGNSTLLCYRGEFEVKESQAGWWYFAGNADDNLSLVIDGESVFKTTAWSVVGTGSRQLAAGWHSFQICKLDGTGSSGPWGGNWKQCGKAVGWTTNAAVNGSVDQNDYIRFDPDTLPMRLPSGERSRTSVRVRVKGALGSSNYNTYNDPAEKYNQYDFVTNTMDVVNISGGDTNNRFLPACGTNVRYDGYFLVPEDKNGEWAFTVQYDDRITLHVDDEFVAESTSWQNPVTGNRQLSAGWHKFTIWAADQSTAVGTGFGPTTQKDDDGVSCAVGVVMPGDEKKYAFNGKNFHIVANAIGAGKWAEMAGLGGVTRLGRGAMLSNATNRGTCPIYGTLEGSGSLSGWFAFKGPNSKLKLLGQGGRFIEKPDFVDVADADFVKGLAKIEAVFPTVKACGTTYDICAAGTLTMEEAREIEVKVVNPGNEVFDDWKASVQNGRLVLKNPHPSGIALYFR